MCFKSQLNVRYTHSLFDYVITCSAANVKREQVNTSEVLVTCELENCEKKLQ